jgi:hypothetical protein
MRGLPFCKPWTAPGLTACGAELSGAEPVRVGAPAGARCDSAILDSDRLWRGLFW